MQQSILWLPGNFLTVEPTNKGGFRLTVQPRARNSDPIAAQHHESDNLHSS